MSVSPELPKGTGNPTAGYRVPYRTLQVNLQVGVQVTLQGYRLPYTRVQNSLPQGTHYLTQPYSETIQTSSTI